MVRTELVGPPSRPAGGAGGGLLRLPLLLASFGAIARGGWVVRNRRRNPLFNPPPQGGGRRPICLPSRLAGGARGGLLNYSLLHSSLHCSRLRREGLVDGVAPSSVLPRGAGEEVREPPPRSSPARRGRRAEGLLPSITLFACQIAVFQNRNTKRSSARSDSAATPRLLSAFSGHDCAGAALAFVSVASIRSVRSLRTSIVQNVNSLLRSTAARMTDGLVTTPSVMLGCGIMDCTSFE